MIVADGMTPSCLIRFVRLRTHGFLRIPVRPLSGASGVRYPTGDDSRIDSTLFCDNDVSDALLLDG